MMMNQWEIEEAASRHHECPNVRKGVRLLLRLMRAVNEQSDGWACWRAPSKASESLQKLIQSAGTHGITAVALKKAITPIRAMVTRQTKLQARFGNTFIFNVDEALKSS